MLLVLETLMMDTQQQSKLTKKDCQKMSPATNPARQQTGALIPSQKSFYF